MEPDRLKSIPLFQSVSDEELREIAPFAEETQVEEGKVLVREGDFSYQFLAIEQGEAEVTRGGEHVADLGSGDFFGEIAILTGDVRNATVRACRDTQLLVLQAHDLERLMDRVPEIGRRIRDVGHARAPDRVEPHPSEQGLRRRRKAEAPAQEPPDRAS